MTTRRVLIVSHVFPPAVAGGSPRMGQFAKLLPDVGWEVTVLTADHDGVDANAVAALDGRVKVVRTWSPSTAIKRGAPVPKMGMRGWARRTLRTAAASVLFPDREILWVPGAIAAGRRALAEQPHDVVFATHGPPSDLLVGRALARARRLPLVVDFRDLWSTLPMPVFATPLHRAAARGLERAIVRDASRVIAVAPRMAEDLAASNGIPAERTIAITNGFDPDDARRATDSRAAGAPFRIVYAGSVHIHYDLVPLWRAIAALAARGRITPASFRIEFVGNLAVSDLRTFGVEAFVDTKPFVAHQAVFGELARADALLLVETPGYYAQYGYAAKVFDYLLTGKPVLGLVEAGGNTSRLLAEAGVGYCAEPNDEAGVLSALEQVLVQKGAAPRRVDCEAEPLRTFNRRHLTARLATTLDEVARLEPRGHW